MPTFEEMIDMATALERTGDQGFLHGAAMHAIFSNGNDILKKVSGRTGAGPSAHAMTFDNTFLFASCTKLLTTICALQCVERGLVTLDEPLLVLLPELCAQPIITQNQCDGSLSTHERRNPITLRSLLTHSSGLGYDQIDPTLGAWRASRGEPTAAIKPASNIVKDCKTPLLFEPGEGWAYGSGIDWAGKLVERLNGGTTLEDYMHEHMFEPLRMRSSTFYLAQREDVRQRLVQTVERKEDGSLGPAKPWHAEDPTDCMGGAGLYSSVGDYLSVLKDLLQENPKLLKRETVDLMFTPQLSGAAQKSFRAALPILTPLIGSSVPDDVEASFGIGGAVIVDENPNTGSKKKTLAWGGNGNLVWFLNREANSGKGIAAVFATQLLPIGDEQTVELSSGFVKEVWRRVI